MSRNILKNTALGTVSEVALRISKLFFVSLAARSFSQSEFGLYNYAISFLAFFAVFFDTGLINIYLREATDNNKNINNINFILFKSIASFTGFFFLLIIAKISLPISSINIIIWLALYNCSTEFISFFLTPLKVRNNYKKEAFIRSISLSFPIIIGVILILLNKNIEEVIQFMSLTSFISLFYIYYNFANYKLKKFKYLIKLREIFFQVLPISITVLLGSFYTNFDNLILAAEDGLEAVANYSIAPKLILGLSIIPIPFLNYSLQTSFGVKNWNDETSKKWILGQNISFSFGLFMVILINTFSKPIILLIFGEKYLNSAVYLNLYSIVTLLLYAYYPFIQLLIMRKDQIKTTITLLIAGLINFISLKLLIPTFSIIGATVSAIITHCIIFSLLIYFVWPHMKSIDLFAITIKSFLLRIFLLFILTLTLINLPQYYGLSYFIYLCISMLVFSNTLKELFSYSFSIFLKK